MPHYGMRTLTPRMDQTLIPQNADQYALFPGLSALYGRRTRLVACDETTINHTVRAMLGDCPNGLKLKFVACAKTVRMADVAPDGDCTLLQDDGTPYSGPFDAFHWLGWTLPRFDGAPNAVLIQERVPMHDEYRIHMIGGTPACGAGCIEAFTPADNTGSRFDPRTQRVRDPQQPVEQHPELIDGYIRLAKQAHDLIRHDITGAYAIDMYRGSDNRPHVLELNAHANSGLYALDMTSMLTAIRANPQEFTPRKTP